jgi:hypothetical protein
MSDEDAVIEGPLMPTAEQLQQRDANTDKRKHHSHRGDRERDRHSSSSQRDHDSRERKHSHSHKRDGQQEPAQQPKSREDSGMSWMVSARPARPQHLPSHSRRLPPPKRRHGGSSSSWTTLLLLLPPPPLCVPVWRNCSKTARAWSTSLS